MDISKKNEIFEYINESFEEYSKKGEVAAYALPRLIDEYASDTMNIDLELMVITLAIAEICTKQDSITEATRVYIGKILSHIDDFMDELKLLTGEEFLMEVVPPFKINCAQ